MRIQIWEYALRPLLGALNRIQGVSYFLKLLTALLLILLLFYFWLTYKN